MNQPSNFTFEDHQEPLSKASEKKKKKKAKKSKKNESFDDEYPNPVQSDEFLQPEQGFLESLSTQESTVPAEVGTNVNKEKKKKKKQKSSDKNERKERRRDRELSHPLSPDERFQEHKADRGSPSLVKPEGFSLASSYNTGKIKTTDPASAPSTSTILSETRNDFSFSDFQRIRAQFDEEQNQNEDGEEIKHNSSVQFDDSQDFSVAESEISDITFGTLNEQTHESFNMHSFVNSFAKHVKKEQEALNNLSRQQTHAQGKPQPSALAKPPPTAPPRKAPPRGPIRARSKRKNRPSSMKHSGMSSAFMEKAAILEDYDYDQEFNEDEEEEKEDVEEPPPPPASEASMSRPAWANAAASAPISSKAKLEKWEMLSDDFDEAAFGQAVGSLRGAPRQVDRQDNPFHPNPARHQQERHTFAPGARFTKSSTVNMPAKGPADEKNHKLLVMYLKSMGADAESAERIATSFNLEQQSGGASADNSVMSAVSHEMSLKTGTIASIPGVEPLDDPVTRKMRMLAAPPVQPRNGQAMMFARSETPGAVVMETRAFGAPRRPASESAPAAGVDSSEDLYETTGLTAVEAELVEAKALDCDPESFRSEGIDQNIVYAESSPLSFKAFFRERKFRRVFVVVLLIFITIVTISLSVSLTRVASTTSVIETSSPTGAPSSQPTRIDDDFANFLAQISGWDALLTPGTPQREALAWLSTFDDIDLETSDAGFLQRYALLVLFFATGGNEAWLERENWLDPTVGECDWSPGYTTISCEVDPSKRLIVTAIDLSRTGLKGSIPSEIGLLSQLSSLKMSRNQLSGPIPAAVFGLSRLKTLELGSNQLGGSIAAEISNAGDLSYLDLHSNQITGSLPTQFYDLQSLFWVDLSLNQISGKLTSDMGKLKGLTSIDVRHNLISGTVPPAFDEIPKLDFVLLDNNLLTGYLPEWSGALVTRQELGISHNLLIGTIPDAASLAALGGEFLSSIRLQAVDMSYNFFAGTIPPLIAYVPSLRFFGFSGNDFSGSFPNGPDLWPGLERLEARENRFEGPYPAAWPLGMKHVDFSSNAHTGGIPTAFARLSKLEYLDLSNNNLGSTIPDALAQTTSIQIFRARNCSLTGTIPKGFTDQSAQILDFGENRHTGTIYTEFGKLGSLERLGLDANRLSGTIPTEIGSLKLLTYLSLDDNELTGKVPSEFSQLKNLQNLTLANNTIIGSIPDALCSLLPELGADDIGCVIRCSCCSGWAQACGISAS